MTDAGSKRSAWYINVAAVAPTFPQVAMSMPALAKAIMLRYAISRVQYLIGQSP